LKRLAEPAGSRNIDLFRATLSVLQDGVGEVSCRGLKEKYTAKKMIVPDQ